jgi:hypothetical protein
MSNIETAKPHDLKTELPGVAEFVKISLVSQAQDVHEIMANFDTKSQNLMAPSAPMARSSAWRLLPALENDQRSKRETEYQCGRRLGDDRTIEDHFIKQSGRATRIIATVNVKPEFGRRSQILERRPRQIDHDIVGSTSPAGEYWSSAQPGSGLLK